MTVKDQLSINSYIRLLNSNHVDDLITDLRQITFSDKPTKTCHYRSVL